MAKLAGPRAFFEAITEHGKWEGVPPRIQVKVKVIMPELSAMYDEAANKFGDEDPTPLSFDMNALNKMLQRAKYIKNNMRPLQAQQTLDSV